VRNEAQKPGVVVHICNPSTWVTEAGGSRVPDQLHSETPLRPPKKKEKKKKTRIVWRATLFVLNKEKYVYLPVQVKGYLGTEYRPLNSESCECYLLKMNEIKAPSRLLK
jgi:hypothetical protein